VGVWVAISELLKRSADAGVFFSYENDELRFRLSVDTFPEDLKREVVANKAALVDFLKQRKLGARSESHRSVIPVADRKQPLSLSFAQQRLWFIDQMGGSAHYNMPGAWRIRGTFNEDVAERVLRRIIERHEPLRTVFVGDGQEPQQLIRTAFAFDLVRVDLQGDATEAQAQAVQAAIDADVHKPFDLRQDVMLRAAFIRLAAQEGVLLVTMHHIASDGWSMGVLMQEFVQLYDAYAQGRPDPLAPLAIQYADYAQWQRRWLEGAVLDKQLAYWENQLSGLPVVHELPLDRPRRPVQGFQGAMHQQALDASTLAALRQLALDHQITLFMLLHAMFAVLLARHSQSSDIVIGTPIANRLQKELEPLVGFFVNTLVMRVDCRPEQSVRAYLAQVRQVHLDAQANQDVPFEYLVERLRPVRSTAHTALFQIMLSMNSTEVAPMAMPGLTLAPLSSEKIDSKFDLSLDVLERRDGLGLNLTYNRELFDVATMTRLGMHLVTLLQSAATMQDAPLHALPMLSADERHHLVHTLNATVRPYPDDHCVHAVFEAQVIAHPQAVALQCEGESLTYDALNRRANQLAHALRSRGVGPDDRVAICAERGIPMVVGMLGILKAGGAYVPLDPALPSTRLAYLLADSAPVVVLTHGDGAEAALTIARDSAVPVIALDADELLSQPETNLTVTGLGARHLAYVIYTSGSTGKPKGVMVEHRNVLRLVINNPYATLGESDCVAHCANPAFDASTWEVWAPLLHGARVLIVPSATVFDPPRLNRALIEGGVTALWLTVGLFNSYLDALAEAFGKLTYLLIGGDALDAAKVRAVLERTARPRHLINGYGPTESTTFAATHEIVTVAPAATSIPIGRPIANTQIYILDAYRQPVPMGVTGELYLGGDGVARGYLNRPDLTAERFVDDLFVTSGHAPSHTMYKTGDLGRWLPDGTIEYLGRNDFQVKIRGFRIELGEIEQQLSRVPGVTSALVMAREDEPGQKRLVAYVVLDSAQADQSQGDLAAALRDDLRTRLPDYMVPAAFVILDALPLTPNGKVDRRRLPPPDLLAVATAYTAPVTRTQISLAAIWGRLLKLDAAGISATANFFELGGHSLLSVRLVAEIRDQWRAELQVREMFEAADLVSMAALIETRRGTSTRPRIVPFVRDSEYVPASFAQQRLWFIDQLGGSVHYNMPGAWRIRGDFDEQIAERALRRIIERHEPLRTVFVDRDQGPQQFIRATFAFDLARVDLQTLDATAQAQVVKAAMDADVHKPFDLSEDVMLRASFIRLSPQEGVMLATMHHIASDGWSMGVLMQEFVQLYDAYARGLNDPLAPLAIQYADYAQWQRQWLEGAVLDEQLGYWERQLAALPVVHGLPLDRPRPPLQGFQGAVHYQSLDAATLAALKQLALDHQITLFMLLHAMFAVLLARHSHSNDIVIGTPMANRLQKELEPLVGFFVNTLVLRADCSAEQSVRAYLAQVRQVHLDAQANQDVPFEHLVERLRPARSTAHTALFQIMLSMNSTEAVTVTLPELMLTSLGSEEVTSKFDLTLDVLERGDSLGLSFTYNSELFDAATIARLGEHLVTLLQSVTTMAEAPLHALPMLSDAERHHLLHTLNATARDYPRDVCLHELIEAQVARNPEAIALVYEEDALTYRELDAQANRLAHYLRTHGVGPDRRVGLCVERSLAMVIGILGILKAGGAYVPLDPSYPADRLAYMLEDSAPVVVVSQSNVQDRMPAGLPVLRLDVDADVLSSYPDTSLSKQDLGLGADHLAYVIYTSGSTGKSKGVQITHQNVVNYVYGVADRFGFTHDMSYASVSTIAADLGNTVVFGSLAMGGCLHLLSQHCATDASAFNHYLHRHGIDVLKITPSHFLALRESGDPYAAFPRRHLILGGEASRQSWIDELTALHPACKIHNHYGPTETTIGVLTYTEGQQTDKNMTLPLGRPLQNIRVYILDEGLQLVPAGAPGELYIGGLGVSRGYLNRPALTEERFIPNPFDQAPEARLYRTGDLVRYLPGGNIAFLGRVDRQLKIRGFRIEPGEIETALIGDPDVKEAVVLPYEGPNSDVQLVAYVVPVDYAPQDDTMTRERLRRHAMSVLPGHMVPSAFVLMAALPLTANGKIDQAALPPPSTAVSMDEYVEPRDDVERSICDIWCDILGADRIGVRDNFFSLGGHSLLAMRILSALRQQFSLDDRTLPLPVLFEHQDVESLARFIQTTHQHTNLRKKIEALEMHAHDLQDGYV
jgi:amino acid adenylation domain-containing protein